MVLTKISARPKSQSPLHRKLLLQILRKPQIKVNSKDSGFTLIELLVAMVILTIVVGITGTGLVFVMSTNTKSDGQITQQANLRRAVDFIGDEVKSSSVMTATDPAWIASGLSLTGTSPAPLLYLRIPVLIEAAQSGDPANTLRIENHGLTVGNAVQFSFSNGTSNTFGNFTKATTYYVRTVPSKDTLTVGTTAGASSDVTFTSTPQNFALQRLVAYYTVEVPSNTTTDKGRRALYRSTGKCSDATNNCLLMIDSLADTSPFTVAFSSDNRQAAINLNGLLCNPTSMANNCTSPTTNNVSMIAIARATLQ